MKNIEKIDNQQQFEDYLLPTNKDKGIPLEETKYPFHIIKSVSQPNYVLNYEGGSLSVRQLANYQGQKWDVMEDKIQQDSLPSHKGNNILVLTQNIICLVQICLLEV